MAVDYRGPESLVFAASAPSTALGVENTDLYTATANGGVRDLASTPAAETDTAWSPDGRHVVFVRQGATGNANGSIRFASGVFVWSPGHGSPRRIASCAGTREQHDFAWSPTDRQIAFVAGNAMDVTGALDVMNADGSAVRTICDPKRCGYGLARPAWSPDGRTLIFPDEEAAGMGPFGDTSSSPLWVANADGSGVRKLTQANCDPSHERCPFDSAPAWSPDGRLVAFARNTIVLRPRKPFHLRTSLEVARANGSRVRSLYDCLGNACNPTLSLAWAPDGKSIASGPTTADDSSIRVTTLTGKTTTIRTCAGSVCLHADQLAWSANGTQLAFIANDDTHPNGLWLVGRDGSGLHQVADHACCLASAGSVSLRSAKPVAPPAGKVGFPLSGSILYGTAKNAIQPFHVVSLNALRTHATPLVSPKGKEPVLSPDGKQIAYVGTTPASYAWQILVADRNGKNVRLLTHHWAEDPAWSPDGRTIAFTRDSGRARHIALVSAAGTHYRDLTSFGLRPAWSPNGRDIVFEGHAHSGDALFTVGLDGSKPRRLTDLPGEQAWPAWSPNGKEIAFEWYTPTGVGLYLIQPDGTHLRRVTTAALPDGKPAWSPDGRYLSVMPDDYQATRTPLVVVDVRTGRIETVATVPGTGADPSWSAH